MKSFAYDINPQIICYNSSIRDKIGVIKVLIEIFRVINLSKPHLTHDFNTGFDTKCVRLVLYIDKMSRIFISESDKIHSFNFPVMLSIEEGNYVLLFNGFRITNASCSILASVFNGISENSTIDEILERYWDISEEFSISLEENRLYCQLITYLLSFEVGYLRFDHDEKNNDKFYHPVDHIDFFYSSNITFKLGLSKQIDYKTLVDIVDRNKPCFYLDEPN